MTEKKKHPRQKLFNVARTQAADVLLESSINFLLQNGISKERIRQYVSNHLKGKSNRQRKLQFRQVTEAYEEMGTVLSTWFDCPHFLTPQGNPAPIAVGNDALSLKKLLKTAKVRLLLAVA